LEGFGLSGSNSTELVRLGQHAADLWEVILLQGATAHKFERLKNKTIMPKANNQCVPACRPSLPPNSGA
jgi:hypothetical protein